MPIERCRALWLFCVAVLLGVCIAPAEAQLYPRFTSERIYRVDAPDAGYGEVRERIRQVEGGAPETYYLVVAQSTGSGSSATRDYTDQLYQRWRSEALAAGRSLDPERHVIIVIGLGNRQISVHAGLHLQNTLGFRGSTIDTEVVQPVFIPYARAGEHARGAAALVSAIHRWIRNKEEAEVRERRAQALAQAEARRANERAAVEARRAAAAARKAEEQERRQELAAVTDGLRTQRARLELFSARLIQARREGLRTSVLEKEQEALPPLLNQVEARMTGHPRAANATLQKVHSALSGLEQRFTELERQRTSSRELHARAQQSLQRAEQEVHRGAAAGLELQDLATSLRELRAKLNQATGLLNSDHGQADELYRSVEAAGPAIASTVAYRERRREEERRHELLMTRTLPRATALLVFLAVTGIVGTLRWLHLRLKRAISKQLATLLQELVRCMERLEALTERHKLLLGADPDFTVPITGRALVVYQETEATLREAWSVWDLLAASRDVIQGHIKKETPLGRKQLQAAQGRLDELQRSCELSALLDTVEANLDRLNAAHEAARTLLEAFQAERDKSAEYLQQIGAHALPLPPYEAPREEINALARDAASRYEADPLSSRDIAEEGTLRARAWNAWLERLVAAADAHAAATARAQALEVLSRARRAEGYLLTETGGNPDSPLVEARAALREARKHLEVAAGEPAQASLTTATQWLAQGESAVEGQVRGRAFCEQDLPARQAETRRLHSHLAHAMKAREELAREFAESCWHNVADNCATAEAGLGKLERMARDAETRMAPATQHYLAARGLLEEAARTQVAIEAELTTVEQTLSTLRVLRDRVEADTPILQERAHAIGAFLTVHPVSIRPATHQRLAAAHAALAASRAAAALQPPDWITAARQLQESETLLAAAQAHGQQDVVDHQRVLQRLQQSDQAYNQAADYIQRQTADRPAAARRLEQAHGLLEEIRQASQHPGGDWLALDVQMDQAAAATRQAHDLAQEDVRLHNQVQAELRSADRTLDAAGRHFGHGVRGDTASAREELRKAEAALERQEYEEAIRITAEAVRLAQAAEREARARVEYIDRAVREREAAEAEERRRREAEEARWQQSSSSSSSWSSLLSSSSSDSSSSSSSGWSWGSSSSSSSSSSDSGTSSSSWSSSSSSGSSSSSSSSSDSGTSQSSW